MTDRINVDTPAPKPQERSDALIDLHPTQWFWVVSGGSIGVGALVSLFWATMPTLPATVLSACTVLGAVFGSILAISRAVYEIERKDRLMEEEAKLRRRGGY